MKTLNCLNWSERYHFRFPKSRIALLKEEEESLRILERKGQPGIEDFFSNSQESLARG
jgi:hypothetical protein